MTDAQINVTDSLTVAARGETIVVDDREARDPIEFDRDLAELVAKSIEVVDESASIDDLPLDDASEAPAPADD